MKRREMTDKSACELLVQLEEDTQWCCPVPCCPGHP